MRKLSTLACVWLSLAAALPAAADSILDWNATALDVVRADPRSPTAASRSLAMVHLATFDAVNAIDRSYNPYSLSATAAAGTSADAAVAQAAHDVLKSLYPGQEALLGSILTTRLATIADGAGKDAGVALGALSAAGILALRASDGANAPSTYTPTDAPGHWQPMPPTFGAAMTPHWGGVTPFAMSTQSQFRPPAPPALDSAEYTAAFNEVKSVGEKDSATRTDDQTEIGIFWGYDVAGVGPPPILYNQVTRTIAEQQGNTLAENARLFALVNVAQADAGIATWEAKYLYDLWRPITAIREADTDGNADTIQQADWEPLGAPGNEFAPNFTPPFPAHTSGHATFGSATFRILEQFYGSDEIAFSIGSDEYNGVRRPLVERSYLRFSDAALENALSRIYLGVHWRFDVEEGMRVGEDIGDWVFANTLAKVPTPPVWALIGIGLMLLIRRRWATPSAAVARQTARRKKSAGASCTAASCDARPTPAFS